MWPFRKREDPLLLVLTKVLEQNAETQRAVMETVNRLTETARQQGEVLARYLDLFKTPDSPRRWERSVEDENRRFMEEHGFPVNGTEEEQARWLAEHLDA